MTIKVILNQSESLITQTQTLHIKTQNEKIHWTVPLNTRIKRFILLM